MRILCACVLALIGTAFGDDWTTTMKYARSSVRGLIATEKGVPKAVADASLCVVILPWVDARNYLMDSTGAFRIVQTTAKGTALCRTGARWNGPWSRAYLLDMELLGRNADHFGEKTEILLFVQSRAAADRLRAGGFDLTGLQVQAGGEMPGGKKARPDVVAFSRSWRPTKFDRGGMLGGKVLEREVKRFGGLDLDPVSNARVSADNAKLHGEKAVREILIEPLPEADAPVLLTWKTEDEYWNAYRQKVLAGRPWSSELSKEIAALSQKDDLTRWAIGLANILDRSSPTPERKVTLVEPAGSVAAASTHVRGTLQGFREVRSVQLAGIPGTPTAAEDGQGFVVAAVPLKLGENVLSGVVEEISGIEEPIQVTVTRSAPAKTSRPVKKR